MLKHYEENFAEMTPQEKENFLGRFSCLSLESDRKSTRLNSSHR